MIHMQSPARLESDDDEAGALDAEAVRALHFGGGFVRKGAASAAADGAGTVEEGEPDPERRRTKKEARRATPGCDARPDLGLGLSAPTSSL